MILSNLGVIKGSGSLLTNGLVSVYKADANNNLTVKNAWNGNGDALDSKSGANATIAAPSGTTWVPSTMTYGSGKVGSGAFTFNGSNFISLPADTLTFTKDFSMSMWVYIPSSVNSGFNLLSAYDNSLGYTTVRGWRLMYSYVNNQIEFRLGETYNTNPNNTVAPMTLKDQWVHIVATRKLSAQSTIYINGVQAAQTTNSVNPIYNSNNLAYIAASYYSFSPPFYTNLAQNGVKIDSIQTWESELSQNFVTELYNSGNGQEYPFTVSNALTPSTKDSYGSNHGTAYGGLTYTAGKSGNAFTFNGTDATIRLPDNSLNSLTGDFSISNWVYLPATYLGTGGATVYMLWNVTAPTWSPPTNLKGITLRIVTNTVVNFTILDGVSNTQISFNDWSSIYLKNSSWVHITATRKGSTGSKLYLNGVLVGSNTSTMNPVYSSTFQTPIIGNLRTTDSSGNVLINNDFAFNGTKIDEMNIWNKELTATEVTELYNAGAGKFYPYQ